MKNSVVAGISSYGTTRYVPLSRGARIDNRIKVIKVIKIIKRTRQARYIAFGEFTVVEEPGTRCLGVAVVCGFMG